MNILNIIVLILSVQAVNIVEIPDVIPECMSHTQDDSVPAITSVTLPVFALNPSSEIDNDLENILTELADALCASNDYGYIGSKDDSDINIPLATDVGCYSIDIGRQENVELPYYSINIYDIHFWNLIDRYPEDTFKGVIPIVIHNPEWHYKSPITIYFLIRDTGADGNIIDSLFNKTSDSIQFIKREWILPSNYLNVTRATNQYFGGILDKELLTQYYLKNGKIIRNLHPQFGPIVE